MRISTTGNLTYDGGWAILKCDLDTIEYYQWFLRHLGIKVNLPIWKSHISVVRGEDVRDHPEWGNYEGVSLAYSYDPEDIWWNGSYWWIDVVSPELEQVRIELGLAPQPQYKLHWTIGKEYERRLGCDYGTRTYRP